MFEQVRYHRTPPSVHVAAAAAAASSRRLGEWMAAAAPTATGVLGTQRRTLLLFGDR